MYAKNPGEIETLIKIDCSKMNDSATYKSSRTGGESLHTFVKIICNVGIIDYKTMTMYASKRFENGGATATTTSGDKVTGEYPRKEIREYLSGFALR